MNSQKKALLLSIGYGQGHHAAADSLVEELQGRGWWAERVDICEKTHPRFFRLTQQFYSFCVRSAPWLWGITYSRTDTADWSKTVHNPILEACTDALGELIKKEQPDIIFCTYPLYAYMLDVLAERGVWTGPYAVVVTDSLEISRPWVCSNAKLICLPDEHSLGLLQDRYALPPQNVAVTGFPVRKAFAPPAVRCAPTWEDMHILYGAYAPMTQVVEDVRGLLHSIPGCRITLLGGARAAALRRALADCRVDDRLTLLRNVPCLAELMQQAHLYIGKGGAATMFECYSSNLPVVVNYSLPGQEQGNIELLLKDHCGVVAHSSQDLLRTVTAMLEHGSSGWLRLYSAMQQNFRSGGAARIVDAALNKFFCL